MADLIDRGELRERIYSRFGRYSTKVIATVEEGRVMSDWAFLEPFLNAAPAVNRWISVEDALPDALQNVLVCTDINTVTVAWINGDGWTFADTGNGHTENWSFADVKYWMYLPEPPKGEQK